jgi:hypothetical protein
MPTGRNTCRASIPEYRPISRDHDQENAPHGPNLPREEPARPRIEARSRQDAGAAVVLFRRAYLGLYCRKGGGIEEHSLALAAKFRRKLRTSATARQACFEPFYEMGALDKDIYIHFLDGPDAARPGYFTDLAHCIFRCPSQFAIKKSEWPSLIGKTKTRVLNLGQAHRFFEKTLGPDLHVRQACQGCRMRAEGPLRELHFYVAYEGFLRERNLRTEHEVILPDEKEWGEFSARFSQMFVFNVMRLTTHIGNTLLQDPLE